MRIAPCTARCGCTSASLDAGRDIRIAIRSLRRAPGFAIAAAALLALGIGGTTAVFSVVNAIYFKPLPYPNAARLALVSASSRDPLCGRRCPGTPTAAEVREWSAHARTVDAIGTLALRQGTVTTPAGSMVLEGAAVSPSFLELLRLRAVIGRGLDRDDFADNAPGVMVLGYSAWRSQFGGDSAVVGQLATTDNATYRIVGVLGPRSELGSPIFSLNARTAEYLVPRTTATGTAERVSQIVVRLAPGASHAATQTELSRVLRDASGAPWTVTVQPLREALVTRYRGPFALLLAAAAVVLTLTCMNVGGLLVARLNDRMPELATRAVLGAGRMQLVQQIVTETTLIALAGGAGGLLMGFYGTHLTRLIPADRLPFWTPIVTDMRVVAAALVLAILGAVVLSIAPLLALSPARVVAGLRDVFNEAPSRARSRRIVVSAEVALSVVLAGVAGILVKQLVAAERRDLGSAKQSVVFVALSPGSLQRVLDARGSDAGWADRALGELRSRTGIVNAAVAGWPAEMLAPPPSRRDTTARRSGPAKRVVVFVDGRSDPVAGLVFPMARVVTDDYFATIGATLVAGRAFGAADVVGSPPVAIHNATAARRAFGEQSVVGHRIRIEAGGKISEWITIVGVVADHHSNPFDVKPPDVNDLYRPWKQVTAIPTNLAVHVRGDAAPMVPVIRAAMRAIDPAAPVASVVPIDHWIDDQLWDARFTTNVLAAFATFAIVLACLGVYATVSYAVGRRRRELAIRVAVGATTGDVVLNVVRSAMGMVIVGLAIGVTTALGTSRVLRSMLYGSNGLEVTVLVGAVSAIFTAGLVAAYLPARRAARVDPLTALRSS